MVEELAYYYCVMNIRWQQGHRGSSLASALAKRMRRVAMELATCRSGLEGSASRAVSVG